MIIRDLILILAVVITIIIGIIFYMKKVTDTRLYMIYVIPVVCSVIHFIFSNRDPFMYLVYLAAVLGLFLIFMHKIFINKIFINKKKVLPIVISVVSILLAVIPFVYLVTAKNNCYASLGYVDAFKAFHDDMKEHYALQDWKETDFDAKYEEYEGLFEEAEQKHDKEEYVEALLSYLASYQDGHVQMCDMYEYAGIGSTRNIQNAYAEIYNNYYGMTLIQLDTGEYVAANVEKDSSADKVGIHNGTIITKWNGRDIPEQLSQMENLIAVNCSRFADSDNIERMKPIFLSCMGEEQISVEFQDEQGNAKEVTLQSMGNGYKYLYQTIGLFLQKQALCEEALTYRLLENGVGYLQVRVMMEDYDEVRSQLEGYIEQMKSDQITSLIIDVRNNGGGSDETGAVIAEQFAKEDMFYLKETTYDVTSGEYIEKKTLRMNAKASIDVPVYILVNSNCISAGEGFVYNMTKLPNVIVVGIQGTNGSFGTMDGASIMPEGLMVTYPCIACLDEDGTVMIDSKYHGTGGIKPEIEIPVDQKAVTEIFEEDCDYELEYLLANVIAVQ